MGFYNVHLVVWPQKPQKLLLLTEPSVLAEPSVKTEDQDFSAEEFWPKLLPKITAEASAELNFVLTLMDGLPKKIRRVRRVNTSC